MRTPETSQKRSKTAKRRKSWGQNIRAKEVLRNANFARRILKTLEIRMKKSRDQVLGLMGIKGVSERSVMNYLSGKCYTMAATVFLDDVIATGTACLDKLRVDATQQVSKGDIKPR